MTAGHLAGALACAVLLAGCGIKAPPRPPGAPETSPPPARAQPAQDLPAIPSAPTDRAP